MTFNEWCRTEEGIAALNWETLTNDTLLRNRLWRAFNYALRAIDQTELNDNRRVIFKAHQDIGILRAQLNDLRKERDKYKEMLSTVDPSRFDELEELIASK